MRRSFKIVLGLLLVVLITGAIFIVFNIKQLNCSLFNFSIIDVMSLLTSVIIGFGLTYLISISFSKENKKNEIIEESLKDIKEDYAHLMQQLMKYRNIKVSDNFRKYILVVLKNIDKDISILMRLCSDKNHMKKSINNLIKKRSDFNYIVTGDMFLVGLEINDSYLEKCSEKYYLIKQSISQCKLELYNN